jgi:hypothetical protein
MLPQEWKREIEHSVEKAKEGNEENWKRIQDKIIVPLNALSDHLVDYTKQQDTADQGKRRREIITIWGIFITAGIAVATAAIFYSQLLVLDKTDHTLNSTMIEASRAWIAPTAIWHDPQTPFVIGQPISYNVTFKNIGKSPALRFNWKIENDVYETPDRKLDVSKSAITNIDMCDGLNPAETGRVIFQEPGQVIYSGRRDGYLPPALPIDSDSLPTGPKVVVTKNMLDGTEAFYVRGCFSYLTMQTVGKSAFCYFGSFGKESGRMTNVACDNGNYTK